MFLRLFTVVVVSSISAVVIMKLLDGEKFKCKVEFKKKSILAFFMCKYTK